MQGPRRESVEGGGSRESAAPKKSSKKIEETESEGEILEFVRTVAGKMGLSLRGAHHRPGGFKTPGRDNFPNTRTS